MSTRQFKTFVKEWGLYCVTILLFILSRLFIWGPVTVQGHSMDPTLQNSEKLIMVQHTSIERFDIVVAEETDDSGKVTQIVKRIIGMPGDTVSYKNDVLTINGEVVEESYLEDYLTAFKADKLQSIYSYDTYFQELAKRSPSFTTDKDYQSEFTVSVPEGQYFLMGDDRIVSKDSRHVGTFSKDSIIGEVKVRYFPLNAIGTF